MPCCCQLNAMSMQRSNHTLALSLSRSLSECLCDCLPATIHTFPSFKKWCETSLSRFGSIHPSPPPPAQANILPACPRVSRAGLSQRVPCQPSARQTAPPTGPRSTPHSSRQLAHPSVSIPVVRRPVSAHPRPRLPIFRPLHPIPWGRASASLHAGSLPMYAPGGLPGRFSDGGGGGGGGVGGRRQADDRVEPDGSLTRALSGPAGTRSGGRLPARCSIAGDALVRRCQVSCVDGFQPLRPTLPPRPRRVYRTPVAGRHQGQF